MNQPPVRQTVEAGSLPRHRHAAGYVAVVLAGAYEEAGDCGRRRVGPGDVVVHMPWEAHLNRTPAPGAKVLNLPLPGGLLAAFGRIQDLDGLVRAVAKDPTAGAALLAEVFEPAPPIAGDWPDLLAAGLAQGDAAPLRGWAATLHLSPEHLSRGFRKVFGVTPKRFRWEAKVRAALRDVTGSTTSLADLALANGFADQAHLTRSINAVTGRTPGAWRTSIPFKT